MNESWVEESSFNPYDPFNYMDAKEYNAWLDKLADNQLECSNDY